MKRQRNTTQMKEQTEIQESKQMKKQIRNTKVQKI